MHGTGFWAISKHRMTSILPQVHPSLRSALLSTFTHPSALTATSSGQNSKPQRPAGETNWSILGLLTEKHLWKTAARTCTCPQGGEPICGNVAPDAGHKLESGQFHLGARKMLTSWVIQCVECSATLVTCNSSYKKLWVHFSVLSTEVLFFLLI